MKSNRLFYIIIIVIGILIISAILLVNQSENKQYLVRGKKYYEKHCANCHGINGEGLKQLIPPLNNPEWIESDSIVCIIRFGMEGNLQVDSTVYQGRMPGNTTIENDEIADLLSYIHHAFLHQEKRVSIKEVGNLELKCRKSDS